MSDKQEPVVDHDRCTGTGVCIVYAPNTFDIGDDTQSHVTNPSGDPPELILSAVEGCPNRAIRLVDRPD